MEQRPVNRSFERFLNHSPILPPRVGDKTIVHGTRTAYVYGCRCDPCRDAEAIYSAEYKRKTYQPRVKVA